MPFCYVGGVLWWCDALYLQWVDGKLFLAAFFAEFTKTTHRKIAGLQHSNLFYFLFCISLKTNRLQQFANYFIFAKMCDIMIQETAKLTLDLRSCPKIDGNIVLEISIK